jgi:hypothetical protein
VEDGKEPGAKGPLGIIGVSSAMEAKKRLLVEVLGRSDVAESPNEKTIHPACVTVEKLTKGVLITCLIGCHQYLVTRAVSHTSPSMT